MLHPFSATPWTASCLQDLHTVLLGTCPELLMPYHPNQSVYANLHSGPYSRCSFSGPIILVQVYLRLCTDILTVCHGCITQEKSLTTQWCVLVPELLAVTYLPFLWAQSMLSTVSAECASLWQTHPTQSNGLFFLMPSGVRNWLVWTWTSWLRNSFFAEAVAYLNSDVAHANTNSWVCLIMYSGGHV